LVWCASMQLAWEALGDWAGGPVQLWGNPPAAVSMGMTRFPQEWVGAEDSLAMAGEIDAAFIAKIREGLKQRFGDDFNAKLITHLEQFSQVEGAFGAYAAIRK